MCGRYVSTRGQQDLADLFQATSWDPRESLAPNWNVAPTNNVWAVLDDPDPETGEIVRRLRTLRWGLVPSWAKSLAVGAKMINARAETVAEKPAYRRAFAKRRCLLPADGFYEWVPVPAAGDKKPYKQPYFISPRDGQVMAMAGLYEFWRNFTVPADDDPAAWVVSCTVLTTEATDDAGRIHPRMPLTVPPDDWDSWLDPAHQDPAELRDLLDAPAAGHLDARAVSRAVNSVRNNGRQLLDPPEESPRT
ncbi:SOS response-associated peptidase [Streptomyces sp. NPDC020667]|uniref:SOS response-associated peptidase n=1 Tax=Streptomyces sp. NPDC020667 TaxID=3154895 RepID=UPI003411BA0D